MSNPYPPYDPNVYIFVLSKNKSQTTSLKATVLSYLNNFSIEIQDTDPSTSGILPISPSNADSIACSVIVSDSGVNMGRQPLTPISDFIFGNQIKFGLKQIEAPLSTTITGLTTEDAKIIDNLQKNHSNDNNVWYDFTDGKSYVVKVSLTINGIDYFCPFTVTYYSDIPTITPYNITQVNGSTDFFISDLLFQNTPLVSLPAPAYNQLPYVITMTFDEIDVSGDTDETFSAHLIMDSAGRGIVVPIESVLSPLTNAPLPTGQYTAASIDTNTGYYVIKTSNIPDLDYSFKPNTGYVTTVSSSYGNGVYVDPAVKQGVKVWNLSLVTIVDISCLDATAPYGESADNSALNQPLMSVILQSYLNAPDTGAYWGIYTPDTVTFKLVLTEGPRAGEHFEHTMAYLPTTDGGLNPSYDISLYDMSKNVSYDLQNGVTYDLTVTVNWVPPTPSSPVNPLYMTEATSRSVVYQNAKFSQTVDPVLDLNAYNAWEAMSLYLPETISADSMPKTGVVLSCRKSNQFGVAGTDDLDVQSAGTQFKVEYRVGVNGDWNSVARGSITQPASIGGDVNANIRKASSEVVGVTVVDITDGLFSLPASLGGLGTSQPPLYFYLPDIGSIFNESENEQVYFRVAIVTQIDSYYTPKISTYKTDSLFIVDRPHEYSWSVPNNTLLEPFINPLETFLDLSYNTVPVTQNDILYNFPLVSVVADSNLPMISSNKHGWSIKNPAAVNGVVPKVNLYFWSKNIVSPTVSTNVTLNDLSGSGFGVYALIYNNANSVQLPLFVIYTNVDTITPNKASWYKSKALFAPAPERSVSDPSMEGLMLLYTGSLLADIPYNIPAHRCVKCNYSPSYSNVNSNFMNEKINLASIQTSSNASQVSAGDFNFNLDAAGLDGVVNNSPFTSYMNFGLTLSFPLKTSEDSIYLAGATIKSTNPALGYYGDVTTYLSVDNLRIPVEVGTTMNYTVAKLYNNLNDNSLGNYLSSKTSSSYSAISKGMPYNADYTVANTLANNSAGILYLYDNVANSFVFDLTIVSAYATRRIDGVDLFVTDNTGSLIQVANYAASSYATMQNVVTLLSNSMNALSLTPSAAYTVTFKPYRDDNVVSEVDHLYPGPTEWTLTSFVYLPSSLTANNVPVVYSWVAGAANEPYMTFNNSGLQLVLPMNNTQTNYYAGAIINWGYSPAMGSTLNLLANDASTSIEVTPGSQVSYTVQYSYTDAFGVVQPGSVSSVYMVDCLNMPTSADYTISLVSNLSGSTPTLNGNGAISYNTINDNGKKSIMFNLAFNQLSTDRIDGIHVNFTSSDSNIASMQIGSFTVAQAGNKEISLASISAWNNYHSATITFIPFRDAHVVSAVTHALHALTVTSAYYVWNVPVLSPPSAGGSSIVLNGGIISGSNITSYTTSVEWTGDITHDFTYKVTLSSYVDGNGNLINIPTTGSSLLTAVLPISDTSVANYTVIIATIFKGHLSVTDNLVFSSSIVDPSSMQIAVNVPSGVASLKTSWVNESVTGDAIIVSRYMIDTVSSSPLVAYSVGATRVEQSPKIYTLSALGSNFSIGKTLNLVMSVSAKVSYILNSSNVADGSSPTTLVNGPSKQYTVSTVPNVSLTASPSTVLIQSATSSPSLLLNLDAKGLEAEGFISLVLVLTQDGTDSNPGGSEILLQFPASPSSSNPFSFVNNVGSSSGNLVAGTPYSATPLNESPTGFSSSEVGPYILTIGDQPSGNSTPPNPNPNGFSLSSLTFPSSSGFITDPTNLVNIMAILTSRRGTDIMVGSFEYVMPPVASAISITSNNGNYYINFTLS